MRTLVRILSDLRGAQAEVKRLEDAAAAEAAELARARERLAALQAEWRAANEGVTLNTEAQTAQS